MRFHVSARVNDIYLNGSFETAVEALERAKKWDNAGLAEVVIDHDNSKFTVEEFANWMSTGKHHVAER